MLYADYVPQNLGQTLGQSDDAQAHIINQVKPHNLSTFSGCGAKIAYCTAIIKYGLDRVQIAYYSLN